MSILDDFIIPESRVPFLTDTQIKTSVIYWTGVLLRTGKVPADKLIAFARELTQTMKLSHIVTLRTDYHPMYELRDAAIKADINPDDLSLWPWKTVTTAERDGTVLLRPGRTDERIALDLIPCVLEVRETPDGTRHVIEVTPA